MDQEMASKLRGKMGKFAGGAKIELISEPMKQVPSTNVLQVKSKAPTYYEESYSYLTPSIYD